MDSVGIFMLTGLAIGLVARSVLTAWLWSRERARVSREADKRLGGESRGRIVHPPVRLR